MDYVYHLHSDKQFTFHLLFYNTKKIIIVSSHLFIIFAKSVPYKSFTLEIDNELLCRLIKGDSNAFEIIFWKYNAKVYNFIMSSLYDKTLAQDLTQNVFLSVWEHRSSIDISKSFSAYIYTIAQNLVYRQTEKMLLAYRYEEYAQKFHSVEDTSAEETVDYQFLEKLIGELIEQLPPSRREIFLLSRRNGLSNKEIASKLSISEKTVETQISRSLQFLRKHLNPHVAFSALPFLFAELLTPLFRQ
jgi:RNA polymerase sigma-70 factor (family 1)